MIRGIFIAAALAAAVASQAHTGVHGRPNPTIPLSSYMGLATEIAVGIVLPAATVTSSKVVTGGSWSSEYTISDTKLKTVHVTTFPSRNGNPLDAALVFSWTASHVERPYIWRPLAGTYTELDNLTYNAACAGHIGLDDELGRVLFFGGTGGNGNPIWPVGMPDTMLFDPQGGSTSRPWFILNRTWSISATILEAPDFPTDVS